MIRKKKDRGGAEYVDSEMLDRNDPADENEVKLRQDDEPEAEDSEPEGDAPAGDEPAGTAESDAEEKESASDRFKAGFEAWAEENVPDRSLHDDVTAAVEAMVSAVTEGIADESLFELLVKGADHDRILAEGVAAAEIKGRNARIEQLMSEEADGDGVPHPGTGGSVSGKRSLSIFELARGAY